MKNSVVALSVFGASLFVLTSCYSPKFMVDDDVYVLKPNEVPVGESLTDETSFTNFKNNQRNGNTSSYNNNYYIINNTFGSTMFFSSMFGMNSGWGTYRPGSYLYYSSLNGFSYDPWGYYYGYYNPYAVYNPYYSYYPYFGSYSPYYSNYYGNGYGGNYWGFGGTNVGNTSVAYNQHNAPRGSITGGFGSPNRLEGGVKVKSTPITHSSTTGKSSSSRLSSASFVGETEKGRSSTTTPLSSGRSVNGTIVNSGRSVNSTTAAPGRSASSLTPTQNRGTITISNGSSGRTGNSGFSNGSTVSGGRSSISHSSGGGTEINNSRSGSFSGGSSGGSSGGGRSGGGSSGGSSGGRRP